MKSLRYLSCAALAAAAMAQTPEVGSGPVSTTIKNLFVQAYFRNNFQVLVSLPPLGDVKRLGTTGLVQEFQDAAKTNGVKYALVKANTSDLVQEGVDTVFQLHPSIYSYYSSVGPNTAGYPTSDTQNCPPLTSNSCQLILTDKNYALFAYASATINGADFAVRDPFFSKWRTLGGVGGLGVVTNAEEAVTSAAGTGAAATLQRFQNGYLYNMTAGTNTGRLFAVKQPVLDVYAANNSHLGFLGLPTSDETLLPNDRRRQTFEGGALEYDAGQTPVLRLPVSAVVIVVSQAAQRLNLGDAVQLQASTYAANGALLEGRTVTWLTSNARIVSVEPSGSIVTAKAVGGGSASITAISEGKSSRVVTFFVIAPCCQIGEGAPTQAIQQMFTDAVARNRISVKVPSPSPVRRVGNGYVQDLVPSDPSSSARYMLAKPDTASTVFLVTGAILTRYLALGGPAGSFGYPASDPTAGGRQLFEGGALAGNPAQLVTGPILRRWADQGYDAGPGGLPLAALEAALSFTATVGSAQVFVGGSYFAHLSGAQLGKAFFVTGLVLKKYLATGAAAGIFGLPLNEEYSSNGRRRQDFEGGQISFAPGDAEARGDEQDRKPQITATPGAVSAGTRIRIAAGGFPQSATLRITIGSQPDFLVPTQTGAYAWEAFVPANAPTGVVNLKAADVGGKGLAVGTYLVQAASETLARVSKLRGDLQTGVPGGLLPQPIRIAVKDELGNPIAGAAVKFEASPGARIETASAVTDQNGEAQATVRLPLAELPALATAQAGRQVVTFNARAAASTLTDFPRFSQAGQTGDTKLGNETSTIARKGALLTASAAMLRYLQNSGLLASPNGAADPLVLNQFLKDLCLFDPNGDRICDGFFAPPGAAERNVNPWRLAAFVNGNLDVVALPPSVESIRDVITQGAPALLALMLSAGGAVIGSHFVAAIGVDAAGGILIHDPNPAFGLTTLGDYLAAGRPFKASLAAVVQFAPRAPPPQAFLVAAANASPEIASPAGNCGFLLSWPEAAAAAPDQAAAGSSVRYRYCDGALPLYQMDVSGAGTQKFSVLDLGPAPSNSELAPTLPAAFRLTRPANNLVIELQRASFQAASVVNAASFTADLAPGGLASLFGGGLFIPGRLTTLDIDAAKAAVVAASPFQLNFMVPAELPPGAHTIRVQSPYGADEQTILLKAAAPALFTLGAGRAAALNQDNSINGPTNPAVRGQVLVVFATGLGALNRQGNLQVAAIPVTASLAGRAVQVLYAGAAPGFPGLNQINVRLPADIPPGLSLELTVRQAEAQSNPVQVAVQ